MSFTQLNPPLPIETPKGPGLAHAVIDYGPEANLFWTVFLDSGEIWVYHNRECRAQKNITMGRVPENNVTDNKQESRPANSWDRIQAAVNETSKPEPSKPEPAVKSSKNYDTAVLCASQLDAQRTGVSSPETAEDWMRQVEWRSEWLINRTNGNSGRDYYEYSVKSSIGCIGEGNTLAAACRQAVLWKRNQPDEHESRQAVEEESADAEPGHKDDVGPEARAAANTWSNVAEV